MQSRFSIITCSVNDRKFQSLRSCVQRVFPNRAQMIRISDARSLTEGYNRGIRHASGEIVIFCHDDIVFLNENVPELLEEDLANFDMVGVAGTTKLVNGSWTGAGFPYLHGQVTHGRLEEGPYELIHFGVGRDPEVIAGIQAMDGLFFAVRRQVLETLKFDEFTFDGFHLYDLDFTYSAYLRGLALAVDQRIHVLHASGGNYDSQWNHYAKRFQHKYAAALEKLPDVPTGFLRARYFDSLDAVREEMILQEKPPTVEIVTQGGDAFLRRSGSETPFYSSADAALAKGALPYLKMRLAGSSSQGDKIRLMNEACQFLKKKGCLEIEVMPSGTAPSPEDWQIHDFLCFDTRSPQYLSFARQRGFAADLIMQGMNFQVSPEKRTQGWVLFQEGKDDHSPGSTPLKAEEMSSRGPSTPSSPRFSIIIPHHQGEVSHSRFLRGIESLLNQTFQDFELLCYHDGPLLEPDLHFPVEISPTHKCYNDWRNSLRDLGIKNAQGEYIVHFNPENILYPQALESLSRGKADILIFPVKMMGMEKRDNLLYISNPPDYDQYAVFDGKPPIFSNIDTMQFVMRRDRWNEVGGWFDKRKTSDGLMFPLLAQQYPVEYLDGEPLGERW